MSNIEYHTPAEINKAAQANDNPTQNVVSDMMKNSPTDVANTIKQMHGDSGSGTASLPKVTIDGINKGQGCGGDEHGGSCSAGSQGKRGEAGGGASANGERAGGGASASRGEAAPFSVNQHGGGHAATDFAVTVPAPTARVAHH
ncbi:MAG: hypothetical protein KGS72_12380 [Cyanobacteria bacterium REEB67]|nr:hypothetical protein [Cyanobacteria bacterium REEB67]